MSKSQITPNLSTVIVKVMLDVFQTKRYIVFEMVLNIRPGENCISLLRLDSKIPAGSLSE